MNESFNCVHPPLILVNESFSCVHPPLILVNESFSCVHPPLILVNESFSCVHPPLILIRQMDLLLPSKQLVSAFGSVLLVSTKYNPLVNAERSLVDKKTLHE
ncbi:hypothetical protein [Nostoc sp.]|uniref:hypothetical protein n=1 Tax=Nostoc sp. TaxID=1180 RepID=UPI002FF8D161